MLRKRARARVGGELLAQAAIARVPAADETPAVAPVDVQIVIAQIGAGIRVGRASLSSKPLTNRVQNIERQRLLLLSRLSRRSDGAPAALLC